MCAPLSIEEEMLSKEDSERVYGEFTEDQNLVILGLGAIGRGVLPLIFRHFKVQASQITVCSAREEEREIAESHGVKFVVTVLDRNNYRELLSPLLKAGDTFLNLSSCVSSIDVILFLQEMSVTYVDSSNGKFLDCSRDQLLA